MILSELLHWATFRLTPLADNCLMANQIPALLNTSNEGKQLASSSKTAAMRCARRADAASGVCDELCSAVQTPRYARVCSCYYC